jgi:hypothetical protein
MTTWTDKSGNLHVVTRSGTHYISNGTYVVTVKT